MPTFFQGLKEHRRSNIVACQYIESVWNGYKSSERILMPFVWSAQLIKDICNLDFGTSDIASQYELFIMHWDPRTVHERQVRADTG